MEVNASVCGKLKNTLAQEMQSNAADKTFHRTCQDIVKNITFKKYMILMYFNHFNFFLCRVIEMSIRDMTLIFATDPRGSF